jgi:hypothetical protein
MRRPDKNEIIFVSADALLKQHAKDQPSYDIQNIENRIKGRVEKAKKFLQDYLKDQRAINPKTGERMKTKVSFEPSLVDVLDNGRISFEDGRHRVLAAKELGISEVPIEVPKQNAKAIKELLEQKTEAKETTTQPSFTSKQEGNASTEFDGIKKPSKIKTKSFDNKYGNGAFERMQNITQNFEDIMDNLSDKIKQDCI